MDWVMWSKTTIPEVRLTIREGFLLATHTTRAKKRQNVLFKNMFRMYNHVFLCARYSAYLDYLLQDESRSYISIQDCVHID